MESKDDNISFYDHCRICLEIHIEMTSIQALKQLDLHSLLVSFNVEIINDNRYPNRICIDCINQLNSALSLKQKCESSFNYLKEILKDPFNKEEDNALDHISIKDPLSSNTSDDFENETIKYQNNNTKNEYKLQPSKVCNDSKALNLKKRKLMRKRHLKIHKNELSKHFCPECKIFFTLQQSLNQHRKKYHGAIPPSKIVCKECGKAVNNIYSHMKRKHSVFEYECEICKKRFPYKSIRDTHTNYVHGNRMARSYNYLCPLCGKAVRTKSELNTHNKINHSNERNYKCTYCERTFKVSSSVRKHERCMHLNDRCFKCNFCPKAFTRNEMLANHLELFHRKPSMDGSLKFLCTFCGQAFHTMAELKMHSKSSHPDQCNFKCTYCERTFKVNSSCRRHEKSVHLNDRCFKCQLCTKAFTRKEILVNHIKFIHKKS